MCRYTCSHVSRRNVYTGEWANVCMFLLRLKVDLYSSAIAFHFLHWNRLLAEPRDWHFSSLGCSLLWHSCVSTFLCPEIAGVPPYPPVFFCGFWRPQLHSVFTLARQDFTSWAIPQPENALLWRHDKTLQTELSPSLRMLFYEVMTRLTSWAIPQLENALLWRRDKTYKLSCPPAWKCSSMKSKDTLWLHRSHR